MSEPPPCYILVALQQNQGNALIHADVEYRYADDSARSLLPRFPDEHVLVFNHDVAPTVTSTSNQLALSGVKVLPAPGTRVDDDTSKNGNMYIFQVTSTTDDHALESSQVYLQNPRSIVARFKQRNADLRRIFEYPDTLAGEHLIEPPPQPKSPFP